MAVFPHCDFGSQINWSTTVEGLACQNSWLVTLLEGHWIQQSAILCPPVIVMSSLTSQNQATDLGTVHNYSQDLIFQLWQHGSILWSLVAQLHCQTCLEVFIHIPFHVPFRIPFHSTSRVLHLSKCHRTQSICCSQETSRWQLLLSSQIYLSKPRQWTNETAGSIPFSYNCSSSACAQLS